MRILPVVALLALAGCSSGENLADADKAVARFHAELNSGAFDQAYAESDPAMKKVTSQADYRNLMAGLRRKLGPFRSTKRTAWTVNYNTGGTFTNIQYDSQFAKDKATETFVFSSSDGKVRMVSFNVNSPALLT
jgi:hypothetical protein